MQCIRQICSRKCLHSLPRTRTTTSSSSLGLSHAVAFGDARAPTPEPAHSLHTLRRRPTPGSRGESRHLRRGTGLTGNHDGRCAHSRSLVAPLLLLIACGLTAPDADHVPQLGRYNFEATWGNSTVGRFTRTGPTHRLRCLGRVRRLHHHHRRIVQIRKRNLGSIKRLDLPLADHRERRFLVTRSSPRAHRGGLSVLGQCRNCREHP